MDHRPNQYRRRYMDDSVFRSGSSSPLGYTGIMDPRVPRYSPNITYDDRDRYRFDRDFGDQFERRSGFYGYEGESRWGSDEIIRRCVSTSLSTPVPPSNPLRTERTVKLLSPMALSHGPRLTCSCIP